MTYNFLYGNTADILIFISGTLATLKYLNGSLL